MTPSQFAAGCRFRGQRRCRIVSVKARSAPRVSYEERMDHRAPTRTAVRAPPVPEIAVLFSFIRRRLVEAAVGRASSRLRRLKAFQQTSASVSQPVGLGASAQAHRCRSTKVHQLGPGRGRLAKSSGICSSHKNCTPGVKRQRSSRTELSLVGEHQQTNSANECSEGSACAVRPRCHSHRAA